MPKERRCHFTSPERVPCRAGTEGFRDDILSTVKRGLLFFCSSRAGNGSKNHTAWWLVLTVNFTDVRITWEKGF